MATSSTARALSFDVGITGVTPEVAAGALAGVTTLVLDGNSGGMVVSSDRPGGIELNIEVTHRIAFLEQHAAAITQLKGRIAARIAELAPGATVAFTDTSFRSLRGATRP